MAEGRALLSYPEVLDRLRTVCAAGRSGTLFLATDDNRSARVAIVEGRIVAVVFQEMRGTSAVARLRQIGAARCSFSEGVVAVSGPDTSLPRTEDILRALSAVRAGRPVAATSSIGIPVAAVRDAIEAEATEFLGPLAPAVCAEYFESATDLSARSGLLAVLEGIAGELGDLQKGELFKKGILARLARLAKD